MSDRKLLEALRNGSVDAREIAIPEPTKTSTADYRHSPVESVLSGDPLQPIEDAEIAGVSYFAHLSGGSALYGRNFIEAEPSILLRRAALSTLVKANEVLKRFYDRSLFGYDGYRSLACQTALRRFFVEESRAKLSRTGAVTEEQVELDADKLCSRPSTQLLLGDPRTWHTHVTGGALDTVLRSASGDEVEWGAQVDRHGPEIATTFYESSGAQGTSGYAARANRRILFWIMTAHGWVNYSREFWHFDILTSEAATQFAICNHSAWGFTFPKARTSANLGPARPDEQ